MIVAALRTPIGRARKGSLVTKDAFELAHVVVRAVLERTQVDPGEIDDIVIAESLQGGGVIARHTAVVLGLEQAPGMATNRPCAAGLGAIATGAGSIAAGMDRVVLAGGTESMSTMPMLQKRLLGGAAPQLWMPASHPETPDAPAFDMSITVGHNTAVEARPDAGGHGRAQGPASRDRGLHGDGGQRRGPERRRGRRAAHGLRLRGLPRRRAAGRRPLLGRGGRRSAPPGMAPIDAIPKALARAGLELGDVDLFEINEAFCSVPVATTRALGIEPEICNVNGAGCSLGHPIVATGARMGVSMVHELRRRGARLGCVSMCASGGMGMAMVVEAL